MSRARGIAGGVTMRCCLLWTEAGVAKSPTFHVPRKRLIRAFTSATLTDHLIRPLDLHTAVPVVKPPFARKTHTRQATLESISASSHTVDYDTELLIR
jgi:hypothetical protein